MVRARRTAASVAALALVLGGCNAEQKSGAPVPPLFDLLAPSSTGITFANTLPESADFNILNYLYFYNGGGVAVGDVDGDGLPDIYFTANEGPNKLYRNKGNYQFEDITAHAGVADSVGWKTGVTMADVNGDGRLDIFVCGVDYLGMHGRNVLYINNGDGTFTDRTAEYGLSFSGYSTQALFFDYDGDGDLDMYLLNHGTETERTIGVRGRGAPAPGAADRLYRNDGNHFVDVTETAGVGEKGADGYGLGVVASDLNGDGCPDLYVDNDFRGNDYLYINNCNGTFTESITTATGHTSRFAMGVDAADFNNDGRTDVVSVDMLPEREAILKTSANAEGFNLYNLRLKAGYQPQFAKNSLQLNRGDARFSEIAYQAGVFATDWSWAALFADLDNDGRKDLFITNGIYRRPNDLDYINYVSNEAVQASLGDTIKDRNLSLLQKMPQIPLANYAFRNNGDLTFTNVADAWGLGQTGFSNGAAYADLNNSGNLDLVVNNINAPAAIYRNRGRGTNSFLTVALRGAGANTMGIGAKVILKSGGESQLLEQQPTRGFQSSIDPRLHFGLGARKTIDSLTVIWPDKRFQVLTNVRANQILTLSQTTASGKYSYPDRASNKPLFTDVTSRVGVDFKHEEATFFDYNREPLMPHLLSTEGPALAVADVNGDGLDDIFVGGGKWQSGMLFVQQHDGTFHANPQAAFAADSVSEDVDAVFLDANGDGYPDLFVVSGGNEFWGNDDALRDRLYLNDGLGNFHRDRAAIPDFFENGGAVAAGDFNGDGHPDLFVGSRVVGRTYGAVPKSHLLQNDGAGHFTDVTAARAPGLADAGMISSAAPIDYDNDGKMDLVVAGEWMPVRIFHQENGRLVDRTRETGFAGTNGWWNTIAAADINGDGRNDLVLGNLGLNSYLRASPNEPARMYVADFAHNGSIEQILTFYKHGVSYPVAGRDELVRLNPYLRSKYVSYQSFGAAKVEDIFSADDLKNATVREAYTFSSAIALNNGNGTFSVRALPAEAQLSPVYAAVAGDFDGDGKTDLLVGGNFFGVTPMYGRYDASYGELLHGRGDGSFTPVEMERTGVDLSGEVRRMRSLRAPNGAMLIVVARNNGKLHIIRPTVATTTRSSR